MKKHPFNSLFFYGCVVIVHVLMACSLRAQNSGGVVLLVNNDAIESSQVIGTLENELRNLAQRFPFEQYMQKARPLVGREVMNQVYQLLLYQRAMSDMEKIDNAEDILAGALEKERKKILVEYGGVEALAQRELEKKGSSMQLEMERVRKEMIIAAYRQARFDPAQMVSRGEMLNYYQKHLTEEFQRSANIEFALIDIQVDKFLPEGLTLKQADAEQLGLAGEKARQLAETVLEKIEAGDDFEALAKAYSHGIYQALGGRWQPRNPADFNIQYRPIIDVLTTLEPNEVSGIVPGEHRFFIGKLFAYQPERTVSFEQAQHEIAEKIRLQRWQKFSREVSGDLLKKAAIGDVDGFVTSVAESAYIPFSKKSL